MPDRTTTDEESNLNRGWRGLRRQGSTPKGIAEHVEPEEAAEHRQMEQAMLNAPDMCPHTTGIDVCVYCGAPKQDGAEAGWKVEGWGRF